MALKIALVAALLMAASVAPPAVSQLTTPPAGSPLIKVNVVVNGTVPCGPGAININLTAAVFANATVVMLCGQDIVGSTVSDRNGMFSLPMAANYTKNLLPELLANCSLVVPTPLSLCNSSLNGTLQAHLQLHSSNLNLGGFVGLFINLIARIFQLMP
ncbi:phylloplanin-like [Zingiber officinale]|uniref:phylloplanin-like n=1 Tax=Zingiber officinale TaxID=94328 RepID=UPI001C4A7AAD|nr:phylloplanin-like [Zingiber officinale]